jgi:hypothetical protein
METFDACVFIFMGLTSGMTIGLAIRNKQISNLKNQIDYLEDDCAVLSDRYTDCIIENHKIQFEKYLKPITPVKKEVVTTAPARKQAGRPKGSKNKTKANVKSTTRKYTRKSSK